MSNLPKDRSNKKKRYTFNKSIKLQGFFLLLLFVGSLSFGYGQSEQSKDSLWFKEGKVSVHRLKVLFLQQPTNLGNIQNGRKIQSLRPCLPGRQKLNIQSRNIVHQSIHQNLDYENKI